MSRQLNQTKQIEKSRAAQDHLEEIDLRLNRQMQLCFQAQKSYNQKKAILQFTVNFLDKLKKEHENIRKGFIFEKSNLFAQGDTKWKQLLRAATQQYYKISLINKDIQLMKRSNCNQSEHLKQIFDLNKVESQFEQIKKLEQYKQALYTKISTELKQQFLSDKIIGRIRRQSMGAAKMKLKQHLQKQIKANSSWNKQNKDDANNSADTKLTEEKMLHNLQLMKLIMNKKVIINDQIYDKFAQGIYIERRLLQVGQLANSIQKRYSNALQCLKQKQNDQQTNIRKIDNKKDNIAQYHLPFRKQHIEQYFQQVKESIDNLQIYEPRQQISNQYSKISMKINEIMATFKK